VLILDSWVIAASLDSSKEESMRWTMTVDPEAWRCCSDSKTKHALGKKFCQEMFDSKQMMNETCS